LIEAARLLERENIQFDLVGPVGILPAAVDSAPRNVKFHGSVSRDRAAAWYRQSDVFVLPTLSDGFALTQLEAMSHGLPVVTTPNCGRLVDPGKTGFIVPPRDARALAETIFRFVSNRELAVSMVPACLEAVKAFSVGAYGRRLVEMIRQLTPHGLNASCIQTIDQQRGTRS
jgi:glycosyltransferase involved in cell wall biosynthesis